jgi:23S rRNA (cytosine1962-C5)-methyltransferase
MLLLSPESFQDYELIDCGDFEKLERFGDYVLIRPEPQAVWSRKLKTADWEKKAHSRFVPRSSSSGVWEKLKPMPDRWNITYHNRHGLKLTCSLALTSFKHTGIFPEQAVNWDYIFNAVRILSQQVNEVPRILNLFAYTGASSLAARAAGGAVTHLDSVKQVVTWANRNMELSHLSNIRWIVEDAMKFVQREKKRGKKYHGIILDPPAYGHGTDGRKWKLEEMINEMTSLVFDLLEGHHFLLMNTYSLGFSSLVMDNLFKAYSPTPYETGEVFLQSTTGFKLPLGVFGRTVINARH